MKLKYIHHLFALIGYGFVGYLLVSLIFENGDAPSAPTPISPTYSQTEATPDPSFQHFFNQDSTLSSSLGNGLEADTKTVQLAKALQMEGWRYVMPNPRSDQAAWSNVDNRTTWHYGYWINDLNGRFSSTAPRLNYDGRFEGDGQNLSGKYSRGYPTHMPTALEYLLSEHGGPPVSQIDS